MASPTKPVPMQQQMALNSVPMIQSQSSSSQFSAATTQMAMETQFASTAMATNGTATTLLSPSTAMDTSTGTALTQTTAPATQVPAPTAQVQQQPQQTQQQAQIQQQALQEQLLETNAQNCRTALVSWANAEIGNATNKVQVKSEVFNAIANVGAVTYYARAIFHNDNSLLSPVVLRIGELYSRIFDASKVTPGQWEPLQAAVVELNTEIDQYNLAGLRSYRLFSGTQLSKLRPVEIPENVQTAIKEYNTEQMILRQAAEAEARRIREAQIKVLEDEISTAAIQLLGIAGNDPYCVPHISQQGYEATTKFFAAQQAKVRDQLKGIIPDSIAQKFAQLSKLHEAANLFLRRQPIDLEIEFTEDTQLVSKDAESLYTSFAHYMYVLGQGDTAQFLTRVKSTAIAPRANKKYGVQELRTIVLNAIKAKVTSDPKLHVLLLLSMLNANASFADAKAKLEEKAITQYAAKVEAFVKLFKKLQLNADTATTQLITNMEATGRNVKIYGSEVSKKFPAAIDSYYDALINRIGHAMIELGVLVQTAKTSSEASQLARFFDRIESLSKTNNELKKAHKLLSSQIQTKPTLYADAKTLADNIVSTINNFRTCSKLVLAVTSKPALQSLVFMNKFIDEVTPIALALEDLRQKNVSYQPYRINELMNPEGYFAGAHAEHGGDATVSLAELYAIASDFSVRTQFVKKQQPCATVLAGSYLPDVTVTMQLHVDEKGKSRVHLPAAPKTPATLLAPASTAPSAESKEGTLKTIRELAGEGAMDLREPGTPELAEEEESLAMNSMNFIFASSSSTSSASSSSANSFMAMHLSSLTVPSVTTTVAQ